MSCSYRSHAKSTKLKPVKDENRPYKVEPTLRPIWNKILRICVEVAIANYARKPSIGKRGLTVISREKFVLKTSVRIFSKHKKGTLFVVTEGHI